MAEHKVHEGTVPTIQGNIQPQMAMSPHHFNELQIKLRAQGVFSQIRVFSRQEQKVSRVGQGHGEGPGHPKDR